MNNDELSFGYSEAQIQALITLAELAFPIESPNNNSYKPFPKSMEEACTYFRRFAEPIDEAFLSLSKLGLAKKSRASWKLTPKGTTEAERIRYARPPIYYWYRDFYTAVRNSQAFDTYSKRVFGKNLDQHGFSDMGQIDLLLETIRPAKGTCILDIGCGTGMIAEYISDQTQAKVTGIDYIPEAIELAVKRTRDKRDRLVFSVSDVIRPAPDNVLFDVMISIDTVYFHDAALLVPSWKRCLAPGGTLAVFSLGKDNDDLPKILTANGFSLETRDISKENWEHQQLKYKIAYSMKTDFEDEDLVFVWQNLIDESLPGREPYDPDKTPMRRYLYIAGT